MSNVTILSDAELDLVVGGNQSAAATGGAATASAGNSNSGGNGKLIGINAANVQINEGSAGAQGGSAYAANSVSKYFGWYFV